MKKKGKFCNYILIILYIIIASIISSGIANFIFEKPQVLIDISKLQNNELEIISYRNSNTVIPMQHIGEDEYLAKLDEDLLGNEYEINLVISTDETIKTMKINNHIIEDKDIIYLKNIGISDNFYPHLIVVLLNDYNNFYSLMTAMLIFLCICCITGALYKGKKKIFEKFIYSTTALKYIRKKDIAIIFGIVTVSGLIITGCDLIPILNAMRLQRYGVDVYQFQAAIQIRDNVQFILWPYGAIMTIFWSVVTFLYDLIFGRLPLIAGYPYIQGYIYKIVNFILLTLTSLSVISFLIDNGVLKVKNARRLYYLSILNPLTFYVAFIFIQLDTLPLYFLTLGLLLLKKREENIVLSAIMLALGISCKSQLNIFIPIILVVSTFVSLICNQQTILKRIKQYTIFLAIFVVTIGLFCIVPEIKQTAFKVLMDYAPQADRVWYTTITYAPELFIFVSIFLLIIFTIINLFNFNAECLDTSVILNGLISYGVIILVFNFSIISTPSTLLHTFTAFIIVFAVKDDWVSALILCGFSILIAFSHLFGPEGDITNIFRLLGVSDLLQTRYGLMENEQRVKVLSIAFTISKAAMFTYALYFANQAKEILNRKHKTLNNNSI